MASQRILSAETSAMVGSTVKLQGHIQAIRKLGNLAFMTIRDMSGSMQVVVDQLELIASLDELTSESTVEVVGQLVALPNGKEGTELHAQEIKYISPSTCILPVEISKNSKVDSLSINSMLDYRPLTLRNEKIKAIFKIEAFICAAFREYLTRHSFVEIHSPKIVSTGTEGGAQLFTVDYFGKKAYLAQSPQFYKQIMVGVFERVFEIGPVYRAEEHDTTRHLNEYISMDFEMGFIESEQDVIALQINLLKYIFEYLQEKCSVELALYRASVPSIKTIPQVALAEACRILREKCGLKDIDSDLTPEAERLLCEYFKKQEGIDLVYVTHYPLNARPFYAHRYKDTELSCSFDLLFRGLEVTTGGQRIHEYDQLVESMTKRGLQPESFADYLQCFKYGMPPHGGLAVGLERLTKQLLGLPNVKLASLFPRDQNRLSP